MGRGGEVGESAVGPSEPGDPRMARVARFQGVFQPTARFGPQAGLGEIEIPGVPSSQGFGLEQQDNLRNEERHASGGPHSGEVEPRVMAGFLRNCQIAPDDSLSKNSTRARVSEVVWTS